MHNQNTLHSLILSSLLLGASGPMACDKISPEESGSASVAVEVESKNRKTVKMLYKALRHGDREKVITKLVGPHLEWWYHGLPDLHYMKKILTGESTPSAFKFRPKRVRTVGEYVIVEGWEGVGEYWVHVWGLKHGIITQFREYFNTLLTVVLLVSENGKEARLWQSMPRARLNGSLPDLVLVV